MDFTFFGRLETVVFLWYRGRMNESPKTAEITLRFFKGRSRIGSIIRDITWADWSHVDTLISPTRGISAIGGKCVLSYEINGRGAPKYSRMETVTFKVTQEQYHKYVSFLMEKEHSEYDLEGIKAFVVFLRVLFRVKHDEDKWFCSELIIAALEHAGIVKLTEPPEKWSPGVLWMGLSFISVD